MKILLFVLMMLIISGCTTRAMGPGAGPRSEPLTAQMDAARKVIGAMAPSEGPVEKYSPLTGKHYSGALEYEPGTGVKLVPVEE